MATIKVTWEGKFNGDLVTIEEQDFNPKIHTKEGEQKKSVKQQAPPQPKMGPSKKK